MDGTVRKRIARKADMNANGKSDEPIVPMTSANNGGDEPSAESSEERGSTKRNDEQLTPHRTPSRDNCRPRGLFGVREAARKDSQLKFTALLHHVNEECLHNAFLNLKKTAAVGVDGVTWYEYDQNVEENIANLHKRMHRGAYRDFLGFTHGFRPERAQHQALVALSVAVTTKTVNWIIGYIRIPIHAFTLDSK
jgi:RNA-directed DNA polymerase